MRSQHVDPDRGVYAISVAAEMVGSDPRRLRLYERRGLVEPSRTSGGTRRYSENDLDRLARIHELLGEGLNLAGIAAVLGLERANVGLQQANTDLQQANVDLEQENAALRATFGHRAPAPPSP